MYLRLFKPMFLLNYLYVYGNLILIGFGIKIVAS